MTVNGAINGGSQVIVGQGGVGVLSGTGTIAPQLVIQGGCGLVPGNLSGGGTLTAGSALLNPTSTVYYTLSGVAANSSLLSVTNALNLSYLSASAGSQATLDIVNGASLASGTYPLIGYGSLSSSWNSGVFTLAGLPAADTWSLLTTGVGTSAGTIELSVTVPSGVVNGSWSSTTSGVWSDTTKWTSGSVPGTSGSDTAVFATPPTSGTSTVTLDSSRSLASLGFNTPAATGYVIAPSSGNTLTLAGTGGGAATISNSGGSQTIGAPIVLGSNLSVTALPNSVLTISGSILQETGDVESLSVSGGGALILSGTSGYSGGTTVNAGTLAVTAASALPSSGLLTIGSGGRLVLGGGAGIGALVGASSPISSGAVALSAAASISPTIEGTSGNMAMLGGDAPSLPQGGGGNAVGGSAAAVPEPGTIALLAVAAIGLIGWARRRR